MLLRPAIAALALVAALVSTAFAQAPANALPPSLSGRWTFLPAGGRTAIDAWSVRFDGGGAPGPVTGTLNWRGVNCGAQDEPLKGTWDGTELRFESVLRANTNTQNPNGNCAGGRGTWVLKRRPGSADFEGEASMNEGRIVVTVTASPRS